MDLAAWVSSCVFEVSCTCYLAVVWLWETLGSEVWRSYLLCICLGMGTFNLWMGSTLNDMLIILSVLLTTLKSHAQLPDAPQGILIE